MTTICVKVEKWSVEEFPSTHEPFPGRKAARVDPENAVGEET